MGLSPDQIRVASLSDFVAAFAGWQMSQGIEPEGAKERPEERLRKLEELMERYPDKQRGAVIHYVHNGDKS